MYKYCFVQIHIATNKQIRKATMSKFLAIKKPNEDTRAKELTDKASKEALKRLSIDLPVSMHKALKQASIDRDMSVKDIVTLAVERELLNE
jgi:hypothetical protein